MEKNIIMEEDVKKTWEKLNFKSRLKLIIYFKMEWNMKKLKKLTLALLVLIIVLSAVSLVLYKTGIYRFNFVKEIFKKFDFALDSKELKIPEDALSFSVYDIDKKEYLFYKGESQLPTVASLTKLFGIEYAITRVKLDEVVEVNQELLDLVPAGSSLANLRPGKYRVKQIMQGMLVPSGNDAAYALAYHIGKKDLGKGYSAKEYLDYFTKELSKFIEKQGYSKTKLYDPSGFSLEANTHLDDINKVTLKLLAYDFVKECIGESKFTIQTPQGDLTWKNSNKFLDKKSAFYNKNVKGVKTGTMADSYSIVVLYEKDGKNYLITCLASRHDGDRYKAVQAAINTILK